MVCDTSGLLAYFDSSDAHHERVDAAINLDAGPFIVSPYVVAELDYLLATRLGVGPELAALAELSGGAWELPGLTRSEIRDAHGVISRYRDQEIGLADASIVVLAKRYGTDRVLTLDRRHFGVLRTADGGAFALVPQWPH